MRKADISLCKSHMKISDNPSSSAVVRPKCFSCGRDIPTADELRRIGKSTARVEIWLLCPDHAEVFLKVRLDVETRCLEHKLYGKPKPDVDAFLTEKASEIEALKIPSWYWRWYLLHRVQFTYERGA